MQPVPIGKNVSARTSPTKAKSIQVVLTKERAARWKRIRMEGGEALALTSRNDQTEEFLLIQSLIDCLGIAYYAHGHPSSRATDLPIS